MTNLPVQWNKHVARIEQDDKGVSVYFKDGTSARGDIVVGADGVHSVGRFISSARWVTTPSRWLTWRNRVRQHMLQRPSSDLLQVVPLTAIVGELTLSGEAFKRQLALGHSAYNLINPELGFIGFVGLHYVFPDGASGRFFWMFMQPDPDDVSHPQHWLHTTSQQEKLDHVLKTVAKLPPKFREVFEMTPTDGVRKEPHVWRDIELDSLPAGRVVLLGDAAHAMTPSRGEGAFHAFVDAMKLTVALGQLDADGKINDIAAVEAAVAEYHAEMLKRGTAAVRASRSSYQEAKKRAETKQHFTTGMKALPAKEIVLEMKA